jgi:cell wall-associated NlpC family hydrolase
VRLSRPTITPARTPGSGARTRTGSAAAVLAVSLSLAAVGVATSSPASADIAQQIKDSQAHLDQLNTASEAAAERYNAGRIKLVTAQRAATHAKAAMAKDDAALTRVRSQMSAFAAQLYRRGPGGAELSLITSGNPNTYLQQVGVLNEISQSQARVMADFETAKSRQATAAAYARATVKEAQATVRGLEKDRAQVEADAGKAQQILQDLQAKQAQLIQAAKDATARQAAQARAVALAAEARNAAAAAASFQSSPIVEPPQAAVVHHYSGNAAQIALKVAMDQLGKSYVYGAAGPDHFDCSGLTMYSYGQAGISLPHYTGDQYNQGHHVAESDLQPGDLVFFEKSLGHMGMYVGNGNFIHAPHTGDVVKISALSGYYQNEYAGAVRL